MSSDEHPPRLIQPFTVRWFAVLFGVPMTYAVVRYHLFDGVAWSHFPLFIANKAISLAAVVFIAASYLIGKTIRAYEDDSEKRLVLIKYCGLMGFSLASIHAAMALALVSPEYYPKFYLHSGKMNLTGELSMVFGVLSLWCLAITAITSLPFMYEAIGADRWKRGQRMGYLCLAFGAGHVLVMGVSGWFKPDHWPGLLPPISLVAFIAATVPMLVKLLSVTSDKKTVS